MKFSHTVIIKVLKARHKNLEALEPLFFTLEFEIIERMNLEGIKDMSECDGIY